MNPFNEKTAIAITFDMCRKGTTRDAINALAKKMDVGAARLFHCMRRGVYNDVSWKYTQTDDGKVKLVDVKTKAARKPAASAKAGKSASKVHAAA